jgi:hypothetical protein
MGLQLVQLDSTGERLLVFCGIDYNWTEISVVHKADARYNLSHARL